MLTSAAGAVDTKPCRIGKRSIPLRVKRILLIAILVTGILLAGAGSRMLYQKFNREVSSYIAHGGGDADGIIYTNSIEALNKSYQEGFRYFEVDMEWTSDNELVLLHDWNKYFVDLYDVEPKIYSLKEFLTLKMKGGYTQMTLRDLEKWSLAHPRACIITDIKKNNVKALSVISRMNKKFASRIIPQIYDVGELQPVKEQGYEKIILTLYYRNYKDNIILDFIDRNKIYGVTIPKGRAATTSLPKEIKKRGLHVFAHTINDTKELDQLKNNGVDAVFTDSMFPFYAGN
jgi:lipoteichoic acid synthase